MLLLILVQTVAAHAQHVPPQQPASYTFIQHSTTRTQFENHTNGLNHPASRGGGNEGSVNKWMRLQLLAPANDSSLSWSLSSSGYYGSGEYHDSLQWERRFTTDMAGRVADAEDALSILVFHPRDSTTKLPIRTAGDNRRTALIEFGGRTIELWRLLAPASVLHTAPGTTVTDRRTCTLRDTVNDVLQTMTFSIHQTIRALVDTLGAMAIPIEWQLSAETASGYTLFAKGPLEHFIRASAHGISWFAESDGVLLASESSEDVQFQTLYGIVNRRMIATTHISRAELGTHDSMPAPAPFVEPVAAGMRKVVVGAYIPPFALPSLNAPGALIGPDSLRGKFVLLDFWGTWCKPCADELPDLERAYRRFKGQGFEILSLSLDYSPEHVRRFRSMPGHAMPWLHAIVPDLMTNSFAQAFGVDHAPFAVLIDPAGRALQIDGDGLHGPQLEQTLARYITAPLTPHK